MSFIELTSVEHDGLKARIAVDKIVFYSNDPDGEGSIVGLLGGSAVQMKETAEEIDKIIYHKMCEKG